MALPLVSAQLMLLSAPILMAVVAVCYLGVPEELALLIWQFGYVAEAVAALGLWTRGRMQVAIERVRDAVRDEW